MPTAELSTLLDEIEAMLGEQPTGGAAAIARVEQTLTDGYAHALELEGERWRLERRITEAARSVAEGDAAARAGELAALAERLELADGALARLRSVLASLRRHADAVRAA